MHSPPTPGLLAVPQLVPQAASRLDPRAASRAAALGLDARRALGGLLPLLDDPELRDLLLHVREGEAGLWLDRGGSLIRVPDWSASPDSVRELAVALIAAGGRHLDDLHPCADVRLGRGIRVHAVLPPISVGGAVVSIRLPRVEPLAFDALVAAGLCSETRAAWLRRAVRDRRNILISGGTGTGKTTLLAALMDLVDPAERILTIEDVAELQLTHPHRIALEARQANTEGAGGVSLEQLLREALRMRPDRIVLGECRGPEVATLLSALNTGHDGGAGTLHASTIRDVPARLEALGSAAGLSPPALARQAVSALHAVVHVERREAGHRIGSIGTLRLTESGTLGIETR